MSSYERVRQAEQEYLSKFVSSGILQVEEADGRLNNFQHELIESFARDRGQDVVVLGIINRYTTGPQDWMWEYNPSEDEPVLYNFGAAFCIPAHDQELQDLLQARDDAPYTGTRQDYQLIEGIFQRIESLGGFTLIWS